MTPEDLLRDAFEAEAASVVVAPDALDRIRDRTAGRARARRFRRVGFAATGAALVAAATAVIVALAGRAPAPLPPVVGTTAPSATATAPSATVTASPSAAPPVGTATVPVYYLALGQPLLYREYRAVAAPASLAEAIRAAVSAVLAGRPLDPDYRSPWPAGASVRSVSVSDGVATVDLAGAADRADPVDAATARAAVQQIVYTVTAVAADRHAPVTGVRLTFDGVARSTLWGAAEVGGTLIRASSTGIVAPVWLISPQQGDTVGPTVTVQLDGAVFEAAARLRVRGAGGAVVSDQPVLLSAGSPARGQAQVTLNLPPGTYTIEAYYVSVRDGTEQGLDGHTIQVR